MLGLWPLLWLGFSVIVGLGVLFLFYSTFRYIPNNKVGVVEKLWSANGSVKSGLIALRGEAGFQPELLRGGWHLLMPFQYRVHMMPLVTIAQGKIGYVFARDGAPLPASQTLACNDTASDFQDVAHFLSHGGQKGPQRKLLREGTYPINLAQFCVITSERTLYLPLERSEEATFVHMAQLIESAEKVRILGEGEAKKIEALARAEAERTARVGVAQALAIEEQVRAYGGPKFQLTQQVMNRFAQAIETSQVDVVPKILIGGSNGGNGHGENGSPASANVMEALLAMLLSDKLGTGLTAPEAPRKEAADKLRKQILEASARS